MSRVHPFKRLQVAAAAFVVMGLALVAATEPLPAIGPAADVIVLPLAETVDSDTAPVATSRRAWRDQLPAVIVVRRARPS